MLKIFSWRDDLLIEMNKSVCTLGFLQINYNLEVEKEVIKQSKIRLKRERN